MAAPNAVKKMNGQAAGSRRACRLWVGTCGYSYTGWTESGFYPAGTKPGEMLPLYARRFSAAELNYTWYQMPQAEAVERQRRLVSPDFMFTAKLNRALTHEELSGGWRKKVLAFRHGVAPLVQSGQLLAVLIQLPSNFDRSVPNRRHLAALLDELEGLPLAVEFRQGSWNNARVFAELEKRGVTLVAVDEPSLPGLFPALDVATNPDLFYVRFHGRNANGWRSGKPRNKFDYDYDESELREWMTHRIAGMAHKASRGVIFFNNHVRGRAPRNAQTLARLLQDEGYVLGNA